MAMLLLNVRVRFWAQSSLRAMAHRITLGEWLEHRLVLISSHCSFSLPTI
jgi:hypothetical protein